MKLRTIRSVSALALAALLAACGGGQADESTQTAMAVQSGSGAQAGVLAGTPAAGAPAAGAPAAGASANGAAAPAQVAANMPLPDCAADGCKSLRIIDGNAEAYRYEAMRRAAADGSTTNT